MERFRAEIIGLGSLTCPEVWSVRYGKDGLLCEMNDDSSKSKRKAQGLALILNSIPSSVTAKLQE